MATVLCVLYDDPVDGYPPSYARDDVPRSSATTTARRTPTPEAIDFTPGELLGSVSGELGLRGVPRGARPHAGRHLRQGRARLGLRARAARRRGRHLAAVLARLPDRRADRQGAEPEARAHRRHRLRPRRPAGGDRRAASPSPRSPTRNSISVAEHVVMMILGAGPQLHPLLPVGRRGRLEHRRLRRRAPTTWRACRSARSPPGGSARRCCGG